MGTRVKLSENSALRALHSSPLLHQKFTGHQLRVRYPPGSRERLHGLLRTRGSSRHSNHLHRLEPYQPSRFNTPSQCSNCKQHGLPDFNTPTALHSIAQGQRRFASRHPGKSELIFILCTPTGFHTAANRNAGNNFSEGSVCTTPSGSGGLGNPSTQGGAALTLGY